MDQKARMLATASLIVSCAALSVSGFAAFQNYRSATAAVASARPVLDLDVIGSVKLDNFIELPVRLSNIGKSGASIQFVRMVTFEASPNAIGGTKYHYHEVKQLEGVIVRPGGTTGPHVLKLQRLQTVNNVAVDVAQGADNLRRLRFKIAYRGTELDDQLFESDIVVPVRWE